MDTALQESITNSVKTALQEDIGSGDITAQLVPAEATAEAIIVSRESAVICGTAWVNEVFKQLDPNISLNWLVTEGEDIRADQDICRIRGKARQLLTGERTALNFLQTLSGTATVSREYAALVKNISTRILDTRKTLPGLRLAQKYAVLVGGCDNHRIGLYDAFLIKENHIAACGGIAKAVQRAKQIAPDKPVEVEVENLDEFEQALAAGAERILLDNFSDELVKEAILVRRQNDDYHNVELEISGNITAEGITGDQNLAIDFISSGALTKHCRAVDYSMRIN